MTAIKEQPPHPKLPTIPKGGSHSSIPLHKIQHTDRPQAPSSINGPSSNPRTPDRNPPKSSTSPPAPPCPPSSHVSASFSTAPSRPCLPKPPAAGNRTNLVSPKAQTTRRRSLTDRGSPCLARGRLWSERWAWRASILRRGIVWSTLGRRRSGRWMMWSRKMVMWRTRAG
jgi:hypothetical protein